MSNPTVNNLTVLGSATVNNCHITSPVITLNFDDPPIPNSDPTIGTGIPPVAATSGNPYNIQDIANFTVTPAQTGTTFILPYTTGPAVNLTPGPSYQEGTPCSITLPTPVGNPGLQYSFVVQGNEFESSGTNLGTGNQRIVINCTDIRGWINDVSASGANQWPFSVSLNGTKSKFVCRSGVAPVAGTYGGPGTAGATGEMTAHLVSDGTAYVLSCNSNQTTGSLPGSVEQPCLFE